MRWLATGTIRTRNGGSNRIILNEVDRRDAATIILSSGRTTIENLNNSFDEEYGDVLQVDLSKAKLSYDTEEQALKIKGDNFRAMATVTAEEGGYITQQFLSDGRLVQAAIAADAETTITANGANYYQGKKSAVDFSNTDSNLNIDLSLDGWDSSIDGTETKFSGINKIQAGEGDTTLKGSDANETLIAGNGDATLYGGGGKNVLIGYNEEDRDARTAFFVLGAEDGARNTTLKIIRWQTYLKSTLRKTIFPTYT